MPEMPPAARTLCTSAPYRLLARRLILPWALQGLRPEGEVLEIGAGSGAMSAELLKRFPGIRVTATDYDPQMVDAARHGLARWPDRAVASRADATALPFEPGQFSAVLSCAMLHHVVQWEQALSEAVRVLRPGGTLVGFDILRTPAFTLIHGRGARDHHHHSHQEGGEPGAVRMLDVGELERCLADLPVTDVRTRRARGGYAVRFAATKLK